MLPSIVRKPLTTRVQPPNNFPRKPLAPKVQPFNNFPRKKLATMSTKNDIAKGASYGCGFILLILAVIVAIPLVIALATFVLGAAVAYQNQPSYVKSETYHQGMMGVGIFGGLALVLFLLLKLEGPKKPDESEEPQGPIDLSEKYPAKTRATVFKRPEPEKPDRLYYKPIDILDSSLPKFLSVSDSRGSQKSNDSQRA